MEPEQPESTPDQSKDELQRLLREALRKQRPRAYRRTWILAALAILCVCLLVWLFCPRGDLTGVTVVAFDDLALAGHETILQGRLAAGAAQVSLSGQKMVFIDGRVLLDSSQPPKEVSAGTTANGAVSCRWLFTPDDLLGPFILRLSGDKFRPGMEDRGTIYFYPERTPLCVVQVNDTLTLAKEKAWSTTNIQSILVTAGTAPALQMAQNRGYVVVYLALAARQPEVYQRMRGWIHFQADQGKVPLAAVLGRFTLPDNEQDQKSWQQTAQRLVSFDPPKDGKPCGHVAIAGSLDVAQQFHAAGLRTVYLGAGEDVPQGIERAAGWADVPKLLESK